MFNISNKTYDFLSKFQRWIPAIGKFYLLLCSVWGLSFGDEVDQTITGFAILLAAYLEISTGVYKSNLNTTRMDEPNEDEVNHEKVDE